VFGRQERHDQKLAILRARGLPDEYAALFERDWRESMDAAASVRH
jgi:hypothetical protein